MNHLPEPGAELPFEGARNFRELGGYLSMDRVDPEIAPFLLRTLRARNGGAEAYLEAAFGLDASRLARLRSLYLE